MTSNNKNRPWYHGTVSLWFKDDVVAVRIFRDRYTLNRIIVDWNKCYGPVMDKAKIEIILQSKMNKNDV